MYNLTQFLKSNARTIPKSAATMMGDRRRSWAGLLERISKLASALREMGIRNGERVAILALNSDRYLEYFFAVWWAGGSVVPMNVRWSAEENIYSLNDSETEILFIDEAFRKILNEISGKAGTVKRIVYMHDSEAPEGTLNYETLIRQSHLCDDAERGADNLAGLFYTGGTTGFPKGVMLSHQALWYNNIVGSGFLDFRVGDVYLHAAPMFHLADGAFSGAATANGATHAFVPAFDPSKVMDAFRDYRVTQSVLVPTMWDMILNHPAFDPAKFETVRRAAYGASPMPQGLLSEIIKRLPEVELFQGYGQTEMGPIISFLTADCHKPDNPLSNRLASAGRAVPGVEIRICDDAGNDVPNGQIGEIVTRSPASMLGYWKMPDATAETLKDGWVRTGDVAHRDDDGFIYIVDRLKHMIVTGGENVFSAEVENAISTHPDVQNVAVIGIPSDKWGEEVHAIVILVPGRNPSSESIIEHTAGKIANYKRPRSVSIRQEPFPLSGAGKVLKQELRKPFWEGWSRNVN